MSIRHLPVRPNLDQLKHQAKDLLRQVKRGEPEALAEIAEYLPQTDPGSFKLADAQHLLARIYQAPNWTRVVQCCQLIDAIWRNDIETVRKVIEQNPSLLHESAGIRNNNWGPPMSYAANVGRNEIIQMLHDMGAKDHEHAIDRAALQGKIETARLLHELMGKPAAPDGCLAGPAYTLSSNGTELMLELGAKLYDDEGKSLAAVDVAMETDSRKPADKHRIFELYTERGFEFPDTPTMALHRGRIDLIEKHLKLDPNLLNRQFTFEEIYPPSLNCHDEILATHGTPLKGATLLHMCIDYDEMEIFLWLLEKGADVNAPAAVDEDGFGDHTPLFATVVSQPNFWMNYQHRTQEAPFTKILLEHGADPNVRASLRKQLHPGYGERVLHEYRNVTPISWGEDFEDPIFVSKPAIELIRRYGGTR